VLALTSLQTDARVQTATECEAGDVSVCHTLTYLTAMGILRMIKLFGWEPKIAARLVEKREQELQYIKIRQFLNLMNGNIK
jgi:hypothetical protein